MLDGGFRSFSMACSTEKLPGLWRGETAGSFAVLSYQRLRREQHEGMLDKPSDVVARLVLSPLERVGAQVEQHRQAQLHHRLRPDVETVRLLLHEHRLPLLVAKPGEVAVIGPVEEFAALIRPLAGEQIALIVAVEVDPEALPAAS